MRAANISLPGLVFTAALLATPVLTSTHDDDSFEWGFGATGGSSVTAIEGI
jgi:hypothetical protein